MSGTPLVLRDSGEVVALLNSRYVDIEARQDDSVVEMWVSPIISPYLNDVQAINGYEWFSSTRGRKLRVECDSGISTFQPDD